MTRRRDLLDNTHDLKLPHFELISQDPTRNEMYYYLSEKLYTVYIIKKLINNSRGKYKRNECLINVCKSDTDLS